MQNLLLLSYGNLILCSAGLPLKAWCCRKSRVVSLHKQSLRPVGYQAVLPVLSTNSEDLSVDGNQEKHYLSLIRTRFIGSSSACGYCYCGAGASPNPCRSLDL